MFYRIAKTPSTTQQDNVRSWDRIERYSLKKSRMTIDEMSDVVGNHRNGSSRGFVLYCIRNGWLVSTS
jgi:hypothetical protein